MRRLIVLAAFCILVGGLAPAQQPPIQPAAWTSDGILGPQLIAWSEMQKPKPVPQQPQPLPPPDNQQPPSSSEAPPNPPQPDSQQPATQSITGTVAKVSGKYVLETEDNSAYQLDDQDKAKQFEGKRVKVKGTLDRTTSTIHVTSIELLA
jgi:Protein of unknown function (DUF5818)